MGSINFNNLKRESYTQRDYTFSDLYLDLEQEPFEIAIGIREPKGASRDIKVAYDINAIKNSLINLFNTAPGERFLLPDYGCDLRQFIFEPMNDFTSRQIGETIRRNIKKWEPRVRIISINIDAYTDRNEYEIFLKIEIPFLQRGETLNLNAILNRQGITIT